MALKAQIEAAGDLIKDKKIPWYWRALLVVLLASIPAWVSHQNARTEADSKVRVAQSQSEAGFQATKKAVEQLQALAEQEQKDIARLEGYVHGLEALMVDRTKTPALKRVVAKKVATLEKATDHAVEKAALTPIPILGKGVSAADAAPAAAVVTEVTLPDVAKTTEDTIPIPANAKLRRIRPVQLPQNLEKAVEDAKQPPAK